MANETQILWTVYLGVGAAVLGVVVLLLGLLRESVRSLRELVSGVWSSAVGVFVHDRRTPTGAGGRVGPAAPGMTALLIGLTLVAVVALLAVVVGYLRAIGGMVRTIEETLAEKVAPGARQVAGHLTATSKAASGLRSELDGLLRP